MHRRPFPNLTARGLGDIFGILLISFAVLMLAGLISYDRHDIQFNVETPNDPKRNWIGGIGAWMAFGLYFTFGAGAYLLPLLSVVFGVACFIPGLTYLRRCWFWVLVLFIICIAALDRFTPQLDGMKVGLDSDSAGGVLGLALNKYLFHHFGRVGAIILFATLYLISLMFLTNFQLRSWLQSRRQKLSGLAPPELEPEPEADPPAPVVMRSRSSDKQKLELQEAESDLGPDMQPVPEPTIRDLTQNRGKREKEKRDGRSTENPFATAETDTSTVELGEVIPAEEIHSKQEEGQESSATEPKLSSSEPPDKKTAPASPRAPASLPTGRPRQLAVATPPIIKNYKLPRYNHLHYANESHHPPESRETLVGNARLMQNTLEQFGIRVSLGDITKGPTITRYELHPAPGVRMEKIVSLTNNLAAALKAERIHVLAPVPGKSSVGVEVPNAIKTPVIMRDILETPEWRNTKARIPLTLGKDVYGKPIIADLADMPHLLIAGATGSGKSVCINSIIASLLFRFTPENLRFVMIDPKVVELQQYNSLPHLVVPVVNDPKKVILALRWVVNEMEKRYQIFAKIGVRNIQGFNDRSKRKTVENRQSELPLNADESPDGVAVELDESIKVPREQDVIIPDHLSYVVVIIDELADLMLVAPADVEMAIARITQMARAAGIHCVVATQRPSVDVITGVIKANIPARIAFQVASKVDSRTILDGMGADKLLGKGDMLYLPPGTAKMIRAQGVLITDEEIQSIVDSIAVQGKPSYELEIHKQLQKPVSNLDLEGSGGGGDENLIQQSIEVIRTEQKASVSMLQRRLRLGYTRAARIMDELEIRGIVGPSKGAEPRDILIDLDGTGADGREPSSL